jgi:hypothetical protein
MREAITQYWYFSLAFVIFSVITVIVWVKAAKASRRGKLERGKIITRLKYENRTRAEYKELTAELIESSEPEKLVDGVALNIQAELEKESDMNAAFENLNQPRQYIYSLYYFLQDSTQKLSEFFKMNGKPLTQTAAEAVEAVFGCKAYDLYIQEFRAFDEDNEEVSLIKGEIERVDADFARLAGETDFYNLAAVYIKQNPEQFIRN